MRPLEGITVVTLEHAIAAPFCTRQLADQGARVIKVERPGVGDFARVRIVDTRGHVLIAEAVLLHTDWRATTQAVRPLLGSCP